MRPSSPGWTQRKTAFDQNPKLYEDPGDPPFLWSYCIPETHESAPRIRKILNNADPNKDDPSLWEGLNDHDGDQRIAYRRIKTHPINKQEMVNSSRFMALSLFNPDTAPKNSRLEASGRAAYYYPVEQRLRMRADRGSWDGHRSAKRRRTRRMQALTWFCWGWWTCRQVWPSRGCGARRRGIGVLSPEYQRVKALVDAEEAAQAAEEGEEDVEMGEAGAQTVSRRETNGQWEA